MNKRNWWCMRNQSLFSITRLQKIFWSGLHRFQNSPTIWFLNDFLNMTTLRNIVLFELRFEQNIILHELITSFLLKIIAACILVHTWRQNSLWFYLVRKSRRVNLKIGKTLQILDKDSEQAIFFVTFFITAVCCQDFVQQTINQFTTKSFFHYKNLGTKKSVYFSQQFFISL